MTVANPRYLFDLADEILDAAVVALQDNGVSVPDRRFVSAGPITDDVWEEDCEQLAIHLVRLYTGTPGAEVADPELCGNARTAQFLVRITRCVSVSQDGGAIDPGDLNADALRIYTDGWVLHQGLIKAYHAGTYLERCQKVVFGRLEGFGQGGVAGWVFNIDAQTRG